MSRCWSKTTRSLQSVAEMKKAQDRRIKIGKVGGPQGVKGEMRILPLTDFPDRFASLDEVQVGDELLHIESCRPYKQFMLMKFREYPVREDAMRLTGRFLTVSRDQAAPLQQGEYYTFDIIGLEVMDPAGRKLGRVREVLRTGANDVYEVVGDGTILVPALKSVVREINVPEGCMVVDMPETVSDAESEKE